MFRCKQTMYVLQKAKENCKPVSRILFLTYQRNNSTILSAIIYLGQLLPTASICLPWIIGRAALKRSYTWHFSTQGLPAAPVTRNNRGLLPHIFTLTLWMKPPIRRSFSVALSRFPVKEKPAVSRCVALCCPDFPTRYSANR